jgi:hypothetical protein
MIYRGPGFLAVVGFGSSSTPRASLLSRLFLFLNILVKLTDGRGEGGQGAKSYDWGKACPSVNHSILSGGMSQADARGLPVDRTG